MFSCYLPRKPLSGQISGFRPEILQDRILVTHKILHRNKPKGFSAEQRVNLRQEQNSHLHYILPIASPSTSTGTTTSPFSFTISSSHLCLCLLLLLPQTACAHQQALEGLCGDKHWVYRGLQEQISQGPSDIRLRWWDVQGNGAE